MISGPLAKHLQSRKSIRNLIGDKGVFRGRVPQTYTGRLAIVLSLGSEDPYNDLPGEAATRNQTIQVDCVAMKDTDSYSAEQLAKAVRDAISGFRGTWDKTYVHSCARLNAVDFPVPPQDGSDNYGYQFSSDYSIVYEDTAPTLT